MALAHLALWLSLEGPVGAEEMCRAEPLDFYAQPYLKVL